MKVNKKLIVPFLSSVIGLSIAGGLGGAFAWYQYNTQVSVSFVGSSVADSSALQIGHSTNQGIVWGRDFYPYASGQKQKMVPVTFGALETTGGKADCLNATAHGYPDAEISNGNGYDNWETVDPNDGFIRFDMYLRSLNADGTQSALNVYLSDLTIEAAGESTGNKDVTKAIRIHLDVEGASSTNRLIAKDTVTNLALFGPLDLDGVDGNDKTGGYVDAQGVHPEGSLITYGRQDEYQNALGGGDILAVRGADGKYAASESGKIICTTKTTGEVKITVTVWLEGWEALKTSSSAVDGAPKTVWNPAFSADVNVRVGMTFDTGVVRD